MSASSHEDSNFIPLLNAPDHDINSPSLPDHKAVQVMQVELARDVVKDMQKAARAGLQIHLGFGKHLCLRYGSVNKPLRSVPARFRQELYEHDKAEDGGQQLQFRGLVSHSLAVDLSSHKNDLNETVADAASARMKQQYAAIDEEKKAHQTEFLDRVIDPKARRALPSSTTRSTSRPIPSPAAAGQRSNRTPQSTAHLPVQAHDSTAEAQQFVIMHLLAVGPTSEDELLKKTGIPHDALQLLLGRFAEKEAVGKNVSWRLAGRRFKELDVWRFPYGEPERDLAIENAIRALDKSRLDPHDKIWQSLLPKDKRNKGLTLSKAVIWEENHRKLLGNIEGGKTPQPAKQTEAGKARDPSSDTEGTSKSAAKKATKPAAKATPKQTSTKPASSKAAVEASARGRKDSKPLSSELIEDSDEEFERARANDAALQSEKVAIKEKAAIPAAVPARKPPPKPEPAKSMIRAVSPAPNSITTKKRKLPVDGHAVQASGSKDAQRAGTSIKADDTPEAKRLKLSENSKGPALKMTTASKPSPGPDRVPAALNESRATTQSSRTVISDTTKRPSNTSASSTPSHKSKASTDSQKALLPNGASNGIKKMTPVSKASSPMVNGVKSRPNGEMLKSYNGLVKQYNDLAKESPRRRDVLNDIRALKSKAQRASDASAISSAAGDSTPIEPLSRRQTLQTYAKYYRHFQHYSTWKSKLPGTPTTDDRRKDNEQFSRLAEMQKDILIGFDTILQAFLSKPRGRIFREDSGTLPKESECETQCWKARAKFLEWKSKYATMRNHKFGDMPPDDMNALWDELAAVQEMRDRVTRSVALGFGKRSEGYLEDVELDRVFGA